MYWLLLCLWLAWSAPAAAGEIIEEIAAKVNGEIITKSELERAGYSGQENNLLRDLIDQLLLLQQGKELNLNVDIAVIKRLDQIRKDAGLETVEDLERAISAEGLSYEDFKVDIKNRLITQQVIGREVGSRIQITQEQMRKYYEENKQELDRPEEVLIREILIATEGKEGSELEAAEERAREVQEKVSKNGDFAKLAEEYSDGVTAKTRGGNIGYFRRGQLAKEIEEVAFRLNKGETSDLIRTKYGWLVIKVEEKHEGGIPPLTSIESQVQEALYMQQLQPELRKFLDKLREQAYIEVKSDYVDTGAPANEDYARLIPKDITEDELIAPKDRRGRRSWFPPWRRKKPKAEE